MRYILHAIFFLILFISCQDPNALPSGKLTSATWYCDNDLSDLYAASNIKVVVRLKFTGDKGEGVVEAFEGGLGASSLKSCVTSGTYRLLNDRKSLQITGLYNSSCPWMGKLNATYNFSVTDKYYNFNTENIRIFRSK
jgi:hypothetical protein